MLISPISHVSGLVLSGARRTSHEYCRSRESPGRSRLCLFPGAELSLGMTLSFGKQRSKETQGFHGFTQGLFLGGLMATSGRRPVETGEGNQPVDCK